VTVDLGSDGGGRSVGERAVLIGLQGAQRITAEEIARRLGTINYEITCGLTRRVTRVYHRDGARPEAEQSAAVGRAGAGEQT
jgi:alanine racemase